MIRGEIYLADLEPTKGSEINKTRMVVILSNDQVGRLPLKICAPITKWKNDFKDADWFVKVEPDNLNNLNTISAIDTFQLRALDKVRLLKKIGLVQPNIMTEVEKALLIVFDIKI